MGLSLHRLHEFLILCSNEQTWRLPKDSSSSFSGCVLKRSLDQFGSQRLWIPSNESTKHQRGAAAQTQLCSILDAGDLSVRTSSVCASLWLSFLWCLTLQTLVSDSACWGNGLHFQESWRNCLTLPLVISLHPCCVKKHGVDPCLCSWCLCLGSHTAMLTPSFTNIERDVMATFIPSLCTIFFLKNCISSKNTQYVLFCFGAR